MSPSAFQHLLDMLRSPDSCTIGYDRRRKG
jgi:hypothetical protein